MVLGTLPASPLGRCLGRPEGELAAGAEGGFGIVPPPQDIESKRPEGRDQGE